MKKLSNYKLFIAGVIFLLLVISSLAFAQDESFYAAPYDVDPPIQIDGNLDDWDAVPNAMIIKDATHVTYGKDKWTGPADLSAIIRIAYRSEGIDIAAEVIDDVFQQPYTGEGISVGDHLNLWLDFSPGSGDKYAFGQGQFHMVFSPGNLAVKGGNTAVTPPEVFFYVPEGMAHPGTEVAAKRTKTGYIIEAYVPSALFNRGPLLLNQDVNFEVAVSDSDAPPPSQDTFITYGTTTWAYAKSRLLTMVFGDGGGKGNAPSRGIYISKDEFSIKPGGEIKEFKLIAPAIPKGKEATLFFKARINNARPAGNYAGTLTAFINGKQIDGSRIINRPKVSTMVSGSEDTYISNDGRMTIWYTPNYTAVDDDPYYRLLNNVKACEFEFAISDLIKVGENKIEFKNSAVPTASFDYTMQLADVQMMIKTQRPKSTAFKPAPKGKIPIIAPIEPIGKVYSGIQQNGTKLNFAVNKYNYVIKSKFSAPDGKWYTDSNSFYTHHRKIIEHKEWIEVQDTFKNFTQVNVPIMQIHSMPLGKDMTGVWLAGVEMSNKSGSKAESDNPSVFAITSTGGVGMIPMNDELQIHARQFTSEGTTELSDREFVLPAGKEYTSIVAVVPVNKPEFWNFINTSRRVLDVNFPLTVMFAFMAGPDPVESWNDKTFTNFIINKSANFVVQGNDYPRYKGMYPYSTSFQLVPIDNYTKFQEKVRRLFPDKSIKTGIYYHCFIDNYLGNEIKFADDRKLDSDGKQIDYGGNNTYDKIFIPTLENDFGKETAKNIDIILDKIGADGIFWDEFETSRGTYAYNMWDGCSGDIDQDSFKLIRTKGHSALLTLPFRMYHAKRIMEHGPLVTSGAPYTRTGAKLKNFAFTETGSITNCRKMLLFSPVALGDHLTERTSIDSYNWMLKALDNGCLYSWYPTTIIPTYPTLTKYMFPFTPIELHSGYVIGKERILTKNSGLFGWGDKSNFAAHVFDREGKETSEVKVAKVVIKGQTYAEVRLPEGYSAAIVRLK